MYIIPNKRRLTRLKLTNYNLGDYLAFCSNCDNQYEEPGMADCQLHRGCLLCGKNFHIVKVNKELIHLVNNNY